MTFSVIYIGIYVVVCSLRMVNCLINSEPLHIEGCMKCLWFDYCISSYLISLQFDRLLQKTFFVSLSSLALKPIKKGAYHSRWI